MPPDTFRYFAYGSNLLLSRLRQRTPSARVVGIGRLDGHSLRWHKRGADGSGKCDVVACAEADDFVLGVVYDIDLADKPQLDAAEALGIGYAEKQVDVRLGHERCRAWLYHALQVDPAAVPFDWYKALVVDGARTQGLDAAYIGRLEQVAAQRDPDDARSALHFALCRGG